MRLRPGGFEKFLSPFPSRFTEPKLPALANPSNQLSTRHTYVPLWGGGVTVTLVSSRNLFGGHTLQPVQH